MAFSLKAVIILQREYSLCGMQFYIKTNKTAIYRVDNVLGFNL
jgi:hypothetical protein